MRLLRTSSLLLSLLFLGSFSVRAQSAPSLLEMRDSLDREIIWSQDFSLSNRARLEKSVKNLDSNSLEFNLLESYLYWIDVLAYPGSKGLDKRIRARHKDLLESGEDSLNLITGRLNYLTLKLSLTHGQTDVLLKELKDLVVKRRQLLDTTAVVNVLLDLGRIAIQLGQFESAQKHLHDAMYLAQVTGNCGSVLLGKAELAMLAGLSNNIPKADSLFNEVFSNAENCSYVGVLLNASFSLRKAIFLTSQKLYDEADAAFAETDQLLTKSEYPELKGVVYAYRGNNWLQAERLELAEKSALKGLRFSKETERIRLEKLCHEILYKTSSRRNRWKQATEHLQRLEEIEDIIDDRNAADALARLEMQIVFQQKEIADSLAFANETLQLELAQEKRLQEEKRRRYFWLGIGLIAIIFAFSLYFRLKQSRKSKVAIEKEKKRSDELLLNILPSDVADELKEKGEFEARLIEEATVLFTDFKGFTAMSEKLSPKDLVKDLNECFSAFDHIMHKHRIEKIKTIGDAYMAAGGLPSPDPQHARNVVEAAFELCEFVELGKQRKIAQGLPFFEIRVGIHTGPVVAGIVGIKKFQYDIWGDTVNTASRMESSGEVGKVNISEITYQQLKNSKDLKFESRGKIQAKGKGEMDMYFVTQKE